MEKEAVLVTVSFNRKGTEVVVMLETTLELVEVGTMAVPLPRSLEWLLQLLLLHDLLLQSSHEAP